MFTFEIGWILTGTVLAAIFFKWLIEFVIEVVQLPPGPWGLPIVGYIPWMGKAHESFFEIGRKYGGIFSVKLGGQTVVVLNDWPSIKASLVDQPRIFNGRPDDFMGRAASFRKDVGFQDGPVWAKQRNLTIQCLKKVGMGKKCLESVLMDSVHDIIETLSRSDQKVIELDDLFFGPIMKFNWKLIANQPLGNDSEDFEIFKGAIGCLYKEFRQDNPNNAFPWLRFIPPNGFGYKNFIKANESVRSHLRKAIESHLDRWSQGFEHDFIDHYITKIKTMESPSLSQEPPYNLEHLLGSAWDLFLAGVDTTNATSLWGFLYLAHNPDVQRKAQDQLDLVVGRHRLPNLDDFTRLPYIDAIIMEVHRLANVVPMSVPHLNTKAAQINGWTIPKGTTCLQNIYAVHRDPKLWDEPDRFKPERFLTANNEAKAPPYLMPFSIGPRLCVGQPLAEMELKLIFSCLLHRFSFSLPMDRPKPTFECDMGHTIHPYPYSLLIKTRND